MATATAPTTRSGVAERRRGARGGGWAIGKRIVVAAGPPSVRHGVVPEPARRDRRLAERSATLAAVATCT